MYKTFEYNFLDWTKNKKPRVRARGEAAIALMSQRIDKSGKIQSTASTRQIWSDMALRSGPRYLTRKVWNNL